MLVLVLVLSFSFLLFFPPAFGVCALRLFVVVSYVTVHSRCYVVCSLFVIRYPFLS